MSAMRSSLVILLLAGCTKEAPPPQPPVDDEPPPEAVDESEGKTVAEIDRSVRIEGPLTEEQVEAVVQEHFSKIQTCFDEALVRMASSNLTGGIAIRMEIDGSGAVTSATLEESSFGDAETSPCIISSVETWSFPPAGKKNEPSTVIYPFFLRSY